MTPATDLENDTPSLVPSQGPTPSADVPAGAGEPVAVGDALTPGDAEEVNLLPEWYPAVVRRRRWLRWQAWATGVLVVVLTTLLVLRKDDEHVSAYELATLETHREITGEQLDQLASAEARLQELATRATLVEQVGLPVEVTRVVSQIGRILPPRAALTELSVETQRREPTLVEIARATAAGREVTQGLWLRFRIGGVTPESNDVATLLEQLQAEPLFEQCAVSYGRDVRLAGRPAVEFEVTFAIDLKLSGTAVAAAGTGGAIP